MWKHDLIESIGMKESSETLLLRNNLLYNAFNSDRSDVNLCYEP